MTQARLSLRDLLPSQEDFIKIPLRARSGSNSEAVGYAVFRPLDTRTLRKYRTIFSGGVNGKRHRPAEANAFLIREKFVKFENIDIPYGDLGFDNETNWFADSDDGQLMAEFVLGKYIVDSTPDTDDIKE